MEKIDKQFFFGREKESAVLNDAVQQLNAGGTVCVTVSGDVGTGKSALVQNVLVNRSKIHVFWNSYHSASEDRPYDVLNELLEQLIVFLKDMMSTSEFSRWGHQLRPLFVNLHQDTLKHIPFCKQLYGKFPKSKLSQDSPPVSKNALENFYLSFSRELFAEIDRKVVLVVDNLQFHNQAGLELLYRMLRDVTSSVMVVLVGRKGPWFELCDQVYAESEAAEAQHTKYSIELDCFDQKEVKDFIAFQRKGQVERFEEFGQLVYEATSGNLRNLVEMERKLIRDGNLTYHETDNEWKWRLDPDLFKSKISIVSLFMNKFTYLDDKVKELISFCSCLGPNINAVLVSKLMSLDLQDAREYLAICCEEGFIDKEIQQVTQDGAGVINYHFSSEDVSDAVYEKMEEKERSLNHRKIANYLMKGSATGLANRDIFEAVAHLNKSIALPMSLEEREEYTMLNIMAARKSRFLIAFESGYGYITRGFECAKELSWESNRATLAKLYIEAYRLAKLANDSRGANEYYSVALNRFNKDELFEIQLVKLILDIQLGNLQEGMSTGLEMLKKLDFRVKEQVSRLSVFFEFLRSKRILSRMTDDEIYNLPDVNDQRIERIFQTIYWLYRATQYLNPELSGVLALKQLQLMLKNGTNGEAWSGFMAYGVIIGGGMNDYEAAFRYANLGERLALKHGNTSGKVLFGKSIYWPFKNQLKETLPIIQESKDQQYLQGDYLGVAEVTVSESLNYISLGGHLDNVKTKVQENLEFCDSVSATDFLDFQRMLQFNLTYLMTGEESQSDKVKLNNLCEGTEYELTNSVNIIFKLKIAYLKGEFKEALGYIKEGKKLVQNLTGLYFKTEFDFISALVYIEVLKKENSMAIRRKLNKALRNFNKWSSFAPDNYQHKLLILQGKNAIRLNEKSKGMSLLKDAAGIAEEQQNYYVKSLALKSLAKEDSSYADALQQSLESWGVVWNKKGVPMERLLQD
jgi:predicted ATPase